MDENTKKIIKEKFESLPDDIQKIILSTDYENTLVEIGKNYKLTIDQMGILERETTLVMMGLVPTDDFKNELAGELKIDATTISLIVKDINQKIFLKIRELLKQMSIQDEKPLLKKTEESKFPIENTKNNAENIKVREASFSALPQKKMSEDETDFATQTPEEVLKNLENKKELSSAISDKEIIGPKPSFESPEVKPEEKEPHPVITQKFSGPIKTETRKTEYIFTDTKEKKDNIIQKTEKPVASDIPATSSPSQRQTDPYREIPE